MMRTWVATAAVTLLVVFTTAACASSSSSTSETATFQDGTTFELHGGRSRSDVRALIDTSIGGQTQSLLFDTGSAGLSVLASAVPSSIAQLTGPSFQEPFDGGVLLSGVLISVPVMLSGQATSGPIAIRLVQSVTCESQSPNCAAKDGMASFSKSIGADGIFGAGLWVSDSVFSPLLQLATGAPSTIAVHWDGSSGSVSLNGSSSTTPVATLQMPTSSPTTLPNGVPAWSNQSVPICWQIAAATQTCTPTVLDTGASALSFPIGYPGGPTTNVKEFPHNQRISATATPGAPSFYTFETGGKLGSDLVTVIPGQSTVDSGIQFFRDFIVVFSVGDGTVQLFSP